MPQRYLDPGRRFISSRQRLADMLMRQEAAAQPVQSHTQGLASLLRSGLAGYMEGAAARDRSQAYRTMMKGMTAKPWVNPDTVQGGMGNFGGSDPGYGGSGSAGPSDGPGPAAGTVSDAPAGGWAGAEYALSRLSDNEEAMELLQQISMQRMAREQSLADEARMRAAKMEDAEKLLKLKKQYGIGESFGKTPVWGKDAHGNPVVGVISDQGAFKPIDTGGVELQRSPVTFKDIGGKIVGFDAFGVPVTGAEKTIPPEERPDHKGAVAEATAIGKESGERVAKAVANFPKIEAEVNQTLSILDAIENHPGFTDVIGMPSIAGFAARRDPNSLIASGTNAAGAMALINQLGGMQFLQAFEGLKGGGHITEIEGKKATEAVSVLQTVGMSEKEYKKALADYREVIKAGLDRARRGQVVGKTMQPSGSASGAPSVRPPEGFTVR